MQRIDNGKLKDIAGEKFELWLDGGHNSHASEMLLNNLHNITVDLTFVNQALSSSSNVNSDKF